MRVTDLPDHARVWIYQSDRPFGSHEVELIKAKTHSFIDQWAAHGSSLMAGFDLIYDWFLVIAVDEKIAAASGCSIDASVRFMKELGNELNIDFFDRLNVLYRDHEGNIQKVRLTDFDKHLASGGIDESTIVFNNLVENVGLYKSSWEVPVLESWHQTLLTST